MLLSFIRTLIIYPVLIAVMRLMGKRQIGELEPSELVVAMLIADLAAIPMQDAGISLFAGLIPILTVLALEIILSGLAFRFTGFRRFFCGKPVILMENGKILYKSLKKTRVNVNELLEHLREEGILDPSTVKYAILETNGNFTVLPYSKYLPPSAKDSGIQVNEDKIGFSVICDGHWQEDNLARSGKSSQWVLEQLGHHNCGVRDVLLFTVFPGGGIFLSRKDEQH